MAATALLSGAAEPRLLQSIADPTRRRKAAFRVPAAGGVGSVVPINALQRSVLDGMSHDVEAVQGAQLNAAAGTHNGSVSVGVSVCQLCGRQRETARDTDDCCCF